MRKLIASGTVLAILASPAFAAKQYWIVRQSSNSCTIVDEKPKSTIAIVGDNKGYGESSGSRTLDQDNKGLYSGVKAPAALPPPSDAQARSGLLEGLVAEEGISVRQA
jgi:hypothetical protein